MHFNKKVLGFSLITVMMLASCETEDKYRAKECTECMPGGISDIQDNTYDTNNSQPGQINITFDKDAQNLLWQKGHKDESVMGMSKSEQKTLIYTKWHNRLRIIDPTTKKLTEDKLFLYVEGERDTIDAVSGASEQILKKVLPTPDSGTIIAMVEKHSDEASDKGIGIYSADISQGIPDLKFARESSDSPDYFNYPDIKDIAISHNGETIIAGGNDRKIKIFTTTELNNPTEIDTGKKIRSLGFSADDKYIFCGTGGLTKYLQIYDFASGTKVAEIETNDTPLSVVEILSKNRIIATFQGSNKVKVYDSSDMNNPTLIKTLIINGRAKSISLSPDDKFIAIAATGKQINFFSLDGGDNPKIVTLNESVNGIAFLNETRFMVAGETGIDFFNIKTGK